MGVALVMGTATSAFASDGTKKEEKKKKEKKEEKKEQKKN